MTTNILKNPRGSARRSVWSQMKKKSPNKNKRFLIIENNLKKNTRRRSLQKIFSKIHYLRQGDPLKNLKIFLKFHDFRSGGPLKCLSKKKTYLFSSQKKRITFSFQEVLKQTPNRNKIFLIIENN